MVRRGRKLGPPVRPEDSPVIFAAVVLGETGLYKWQMKALERAARGKRVALRAANGSGKTDKVIGILALWFLWRFPPWAHAYYVRLMAPGKKPALACPGTAPEQPIPCGLEMAQELPRGNAGRGIHRRLFHQPRREGGRLARACDGRIQG